MNTPGGTCKMRPFLKLHKAFGDSSDFEQLPIVTLAQKVGRRVLTAPLPEFSISDWHVLTSGWAYVAPLVAPLLPLCCGSDLNFVSRLP